MISNQDLDTILDASEFLINQSFAVYLLPQIYVHTSNKSSEASSEQLS